MSPERQIDKIQAMVYNVQDRQSTVKPQVLSDNDLSYAQRPKTVLAEPVLSHFKSYTLQDGEMPCL